MAACGMFLELFLLKLSSTPSGVHIFRPAALQEAPTCMYHQQEGPAAYFLSSVSSFAARVHHRPYELPREPLLKEPLLKGRCAGARCRMNLAGKSTDVAGGVCPLADLERY